MPKPSLLLLLVIGAISGLLPAAARAELIVIDGQVRLRDEAGMQLPTRGLRMRDVEARFGAPANRGATVGNPPITRWDYPAFSVYFEHDIVLHSVVHGG